MPSPYSPYRGLTEPLGSCHAAGTPMGCTGWGGMQSGFDHILDFFRRDAGEATRTWGVLFQSHKAKGQKTLSPKLDRGSADIQITSDLLALPTVCSHPNNPGTLHQSHGKTSSPYPCFERRVFFGGQYNGRCSFHNALAYKMPYYKSRYL